MYAKKQILSKSHHLGKFLCLVLVSLGISVCNTTILHAMTMSIVRDAEIECYLKDLSRPIFLAANMKPENIDIHLVAAEDINAFVSSGNHMFIMTPLITFSDNSDALLGVMAHEIGHIAKGHLVRGAAAGPSVAQQILMVVLTAATTALANPHLGIGLATALMQISIRSNLAYSRMHEMEADSAALHYLNKIKRTTYGIYDFMSYLNEAIQKEWYYKYLDPYTATHPLPEKRTDHFRTSKERNSKTPLTRDAKLEHQHRRVKAKIMGFFGKNYRHFNPYPTGKPDASTAKYNNFYAAYQELHRVYAIHNYNEALKIVNKLIADYSHDPYLHGIKAQILFMQNKLTEAIKQFRIAVQLDPQNMLIQYELAQALMTTDSHQYLTEAIGIIRAFAISEPYNAAPHRELATIYQKLGDDMMAGVQLAEEAVILNQCPEAIIHAKRVINNKDQGSVNAAYCRIQAQDIVEYCQARSLF